MSKFDYKKIKDKYADSLSQYNLNEVFNNPNHGTLNFKEIRSEFERFLNFIYELEILDYKSNLYQQEINQVDSARNNLITSFNQIKQFDIAQPNATNVRQELIDRIKNIISSNESILDGILVRLQSKNFLRSPDTGEQVQKIQNVLSELEKQRGDLSRQIKEQEGILTKQKEEFTKKIKELESSGLATSKESQGLAVEELDKFFSIQADKHKLEADGREENKNSNLFKRLWSGDGWLRERSLAITFLFLSILLITGLFIFSVYGLVFGNLKTEIFDHIWGLRSTLIIVAFFSILYANLYFKTMQFSREKEMQFYNENKANIAKTLKDYTRGLSEADRAVILAKAAETLFNDVPHDNGKTTDKNNISIPVNLPGIR